MKVELHVPVEQYGFVAAEMEIENEDDNWNETIKATYDFIQDAFKSQPINQLPNLPTKEWRALLVKYLNGEGMSEEEMHKLSPAQSEFIHDIDLALYTLNRRLKK